MSSPSPTFSFTKLIVADLERMAAFYRDVYGLNQIARVQAHIGPDAIDEIMLGVGTEVSPGSLVLLKFLERLPPQNGEVILGFTTDRLPALLDRLRSAGGRIHADIKEMPELGLKVAFATDPEGHLAEIVQMNS
jgi:lactoylglutathione lyase